MSGDQRRSRPRSVGLRISHSASAEAAQDAKMTEAERAELVELLLKSEREFMQELEGLNERQWSFKLGPDRWSVGEVVEHIVLAEGLLFGRSHMLLREDEDAVIEKRVANHGERVVVESGTQLDSRDRGSDRR